VAYDAGTGTLKRRYARYFGYDANPNLAYDRGRLYVAGNMLEAFDAATGRELFTTHVAYPSKYGILHGAMEDPIVSDGLVFTSIGRLQNGGFSARYFAFDASTGRLRWSVGRDGATLTASGRRVYVAYDDQGCDAPGCVQSHGAAYNARSGQVLWQRPMTDEASGAWMAAGGRLYQAREARGANLNYPGPASTVSFTVAGVEKWRAQGFVPLAVANGRIFGLYHQHFAALSAATGRLIWHRPESEDHALLYQIRSPMAVANGVVYLAQRKDIEAVDATSGKRLAVIPLPRSFTSFGDIEIADGMLLEIANSCCDASGAYTGSSLLAFSRNSAER
jgi:outer membrane protein assembly factor BamB